MTINREIDWITGIALASVLFAVVMFSARGIAQTPSPRPDVPLMGTSGVYRISCHSPEDTDMASICFVRTDLADPIELGCVAAGPSADVSLDLNVVETAGDDAEIRCYAVDTDGLVGDYSENAGTVDFTRPGRPYVN